jgi:AP endonuclease-2
LNQIIYNPSAEENTDNVNSSSFYLIDAFRSVNPEEKNAFTCWSTQLNARSTNYGTRIDYILIDLRLQGQMDDCIILKDVLGSDHCPVKAVFNLKIITAAKCPSFCTKYYPEFVGTQKKISEFFGSKFSVQEFRMGTELRCKCMSVVSGKRKMVDSKVQFKKSKNVTGKQIGISNFLQLLPSGGQNRNSCGRNSLSEISRNSFESTSFEALSQSRVDIPEENLESAMFNESVRQENRSAALEVEEKTSHTWRNLFTGPKPPPKCRSHREPCVQRCVKKRGPNFSRKFWVCARGEGRSNDPSARCDYFLWDSNR